MSIQTDNLDGFGDTYLLIVSSVVRIGGFNHAMVHVEPHVDCDVATGSMLGEVAEMHTGE